MLGLWLAENKDAKFLLSVLIEVRQRGVHDIYIASMDGLEGLPEAVNVVFPKTLTQLCIVHLVRASFRYVSRRGARWWGLRSRASTGLLVPRRLWPSSMRSKSNGVPSIAPCKGVAHKLGQHHSVLPVPAGDHAR